MKAHIKVLRTEWSGRATEKAVPIEKQLAVGVGEQITDAFDKNPYSCSLEIMDITPEQLIIKTNKLVPRNETGGIDLKRPVENLESTVHLGETVSLVTQTMDSGVSYEVTFLQSSE